MFALFSLTKLSYVAPSPKYIKMAQFYCIDWYWKISVKSDDALLKVFEKYNNIL